MFGHYLFAKLVERGSVPPNCANNQEFTIVDSQEKRVKEASILLPRGIFYFWSRQWYRSNKSSLFFCGPKFIFISLKQITEDATLTLMLETLLCKVSVVRDSLPLASLSCATVPTRSCIWLPNVAMFVVRVSRSWGTLISSGDVLNLSSTRFRLLLIVVTCRTVQVTILRYIVQGGNHAILLLNMRIHMFYR